jgi:hypothetical protein
VGGVIGGAAAFAGAAAGTYALAGLGMSSTTLGGALVGGAITGAVSGGLAGMGNAYAFGGGLEAGFFEGSWDETWKAGVFGAVAGGILGAGSGYMSAKSSSLAKLAVRKTLDGAVKNGSKIGETYFPGVMKVTTNLLAKGIKNAAPFVMAMGAQSSVLVDVYAVNGGPLPNDAIGRNLGRWANFSGGAQYGGAVCYGGNASSTNSGGDFSAGPDFGCKEPASERDFFKPKGKAVENLPQYPRAAAGY